VWERGRGVRLWGSKIIASNFFIENFTKEIFVPTCAAMSKSVSPLTADGHLFSWIYKKGHKFADRRDVWFYALAELRFLPYGPAYMHCCRT